MGDDLNKFFNDFLEKESLFKNRKVLQTSYIPNQIQHREEQIKQIADVLAPVLKHEKPSNLFIYGKTGSGKTLSVKYTVSEIQRVAEKKNIDLTFVYLNCKLRKTADTEYRLLAQLAREFGKSIPSTGIPTNDVYHIFIEAVEKKEHPVVLILDEVDQLIKKSGDNVLYNLTRINEELSGSQMSMVGISNDLTFTEHLDPRVKSSLSEEELIFPPYNAIQIQDILRQRAELAFAKGTISPGVIEKCAAYAAHDHGDARRALELLRVAGEIAEREGSKKINIEHIDKAEHKIETDNIVEAVITQPKQFQAALYSIINVCAKQTKVLFTGEAYESYKDICAKTGLRPLTQRRLSDIISEFDMLGIIRAQIISKGRYGKTREISLAIPSTTQLKIKKILEEGLALT